MLDTRIFYSFEEGRTRCTRAEWREALLNGWDKVIIKGQCRRLVAVSIGAGVYEVTLSPKLGW
jgi:hypothetical protein